MTATETVTKMADKTPFVYRLATRSNFTLAEYVLYNALPAAFLIAACPVYIFCQCRKHGWYFWTKMALAITLFAFQIAQQVLWTNTDVATYSHWALGPIPIILSCFAAVYIALMLESELSRDIQSSTLADIYFFMSIMFDTIQAGSSFFYKDQIKVAIGQTAVLLAKVTLFIHQEYSATTLSEDGASASNLVRRIYKALESRANKVITMNDLNDLPAAFSTASLVQQFEDVWTTVEEFTKQYCLVFTTFILCCRPFLLAIIPKILATICKSSQPFLIQEAIAVIRKDNASDQEKNRLVIATVLVYGGGAVFSFIYLALMDHTNAKIRAVLTGKICLKSFSLQSIEAAKGASMTHSAADIDVITENLIFIHDLWTGFIQIGFIIYLLWLHVGYSSCILFIPAIITICWTMFFGPRIGAARKAWSAKIEDRVSQTTQILSESKQLKTLGFQTAVSEYIHQLRDTEMRFQRRFHIYNSYIVFMAMATSGTTPVLIVAGALFLAEIPIPLNAKSIFTILAIIKLSLWPLQLISTAYRQINSMLVSFDRIQEFIRLQDQADKRTCIRPPRSVISPNLGINPATQAFIKRPIDLQNVDIGGELNANPILRNVDITVPRRYLAIARGPNATGKTILLNALVGEGNIFGGDCMFARDRLDIALKHPGFAIYCCLVEDIEQMLNGDETTAGNAGSRLSSGQRQRISLARAIYSKSSVLVLDDVFSGLDNKTARRIFTGLFNRNGLLRQLGTTAVIATQKAEFFPAADLQLVFMGQGRVRMRNGFRRDIDDNPPENPSQEQRSASKDRVKMTDAESKLDAMTKKNDIYQKTDLADYKFFLNSGSRKLFYLFLITSAITTLGERIPDIYMRYWLNRLPSRITLLIGYAMLSTSSMFGYLSMSAVFYHGLVPQYGQNMHKMLVDSMLGATIPYLASTNHGAMVNRISQHMTLITQQFARDLFKLPYAFLNAAMDIAIIASASYYTLTILPIMAILIYLVQLIYLRISRKLQALDLEAKTPMYSLLAEVGSGVSHVRSFGWKNDYMKRIYRVLDDSQKPFYSKACVQRWLKFFMDVTTTCIAVALMCLAAFRGKYTSESSIGLAFVTLMGLKEGIHFFMDQWIAIETSLGCIEGIRSLVAQVPLEKNGDDSEDPLPEDWPLSGAIECKNMSASYETGAQPRATLKDITFSIADQGRAAIKGRTGSGKSTVFLTLLNALNYKGRIRIDGRELRNIPLDRLRSKIALCPSENLRLPGTIKQNLMPWLLNDPDGGRLHDLGLSEIISALELTDDINAAGGLGAPMEGLVLSAGQDQAFSIARTVLTKLHRSSRIILMDELTSNLDPGKEHMILRAIRVAFAGCTVVTIAHRERTMQEAHMVYTMENGRMESRLGGISASSERATDDTEASSSQTGNSQHPSESVQPQGLPIEEDGLGWSMQHVEPSANQ